MLTVDLQNVLESSSGLWIPSEEQCLHWCQSAIQSSRHCDGEDLEVVLRLVEFDESQDLNRDYRGKDKPTNILSFPFEWPEELPVEARPAFTALGDLVVCAPLVAQEAREQGKSPEAHWAHLLIHGMLHLQGFDHVLDQDAEVMENLEIAILKQLGYENPYESL